MLREKADLIILMPVFEDWEAARALLYQFRTLRDQLPPKVHFLLVDDGSLVQPSEPLHTILPNGCSLEILRLVRNLGHQQAIAVALCYAYDRLRADGIIVMDSDGEDPPCAIPGLLRRGAECANDCVVFASRKRRSEGVLFTASYHLYRLIHWMLTGIEVRVGSFSYLPWKFLHRLVVSSELWNHYAATIFVSRVPYVLIPVARASRLSGSSKMNFPSLVSHGLAAISVFSAQVGARMLIVLGTLILFSGLLFVAVLLIRTATTLAIPGWATNATGLLLLLTIQLFSMAGVFAFLVVLGRSSAKTLPLRDYGFFVAHPDTHGPSP